MQLLTTVTHRLFLILIFLIFLSTTITAQGVVIKEKVTIAPKSATYNNITSDDIPTQSLQLDYPAEVTCRDLGYWSSLDYTTISPGSTRCGTPPGYTVRHLFWIVSCNGAIVRCNDSQCDDDCLPGEYADYGGTFGIFYGGTLSFYPCGKDVDGILKVGSTPFYIGNDPWGGIGLCEKIMHEDGTWEYHYIHQFSISITRLTFWPPVAISLGGVQSIMYMDAKEMYIGLKDSRDNTTQGLGPTPVKYYVKITDGKEWGYLYNQATGQYGDSILCTASDCDTSFTFLAMNQQPSEDQQVMLRIWSDDTSLIPATARITVQSTKCMLLSMSKPQILPGERDSINMMQNLWDGTSIPYPSDQLFSIRLNTGGKWYGTLLCAATGDTGQVLTGLQQPFEFIAADSINVDSVVVQIEANAVIVQGGIGNVKDTLHSVPIMAKQQTKAKNISAVPSEMKRKNIEISIQKMQLSLDKESEKKGDENQKQRLAYGIKKLKAQLAAFKTAMNPTKKQSSLVNIKQTSLSFLGEIGCTGKDSVIIKKEEGCPVLSITPTKIIAGESATITMKKQKSDGTLVDYPLGQTFDIEIADADMQYADLSDGKGNKFRILKNVSLPVSLKASADIFNEVTITINGKPTDGVPPHCGNPTAQLTIEDGCSSVSPSAPRCSSVTNDPSVTIKINPDGFGGVVGDACSKPNTLGFFKPMPFNNPNAFQPPAVNACYNETERKWKVTVPEITINTIVGLCKNKFEGIEGFGKVLVTDLASLPQGDICSNWKLENDLKRHYNYPVKNIDMYYFREILISHEFAHSLKYNKIMLPFISDLNKKLDEIKVSCRDAQTAEQLQESAKKLVASAIKDFIRLVNEKWSEFINTDTDAMEQENHGNIRKIIDDMLKELSELKKQYGCQ